MNTEQDLIDRIIAKDETAFNQLLNQYKDYCITISYQVLKNYSDAEEIVQDAFVKIYFKIQKFQRKSSLKTWIFRIVWNLSINKLKSRKEFYNLDEVSSKKIESSISKNQSLDGSKQDEMQALFLKELNLLEKNYRLALFLFYKMNLSIKEIKESTQWSESKVKTLLHRGREIIKEKLLKYELE